MNALVFLPLGRLRVALLKKKREKKKQTKQAKNS